MSKTAWTVFRVCPNGGKIKILESVPATSPMQVVKKAIKKMFKASGNKVYQFKDLYAQAKERSKRRALPFKYTNCRVELTQRTAKARAAIPSLKPDYYKPIAHRVKNNDSESGSSGAPVRVKIGNGCRGRDDRANDVKGGSVNGEYFNGGSVDGESFNGGSNDGVYFDGGSIEEGALPEDGIIDGGSDDPESFNGGSDDGVYFEGGSIAQSALSEGGILEGGSVEGGSHERRKSSKGKSKGKSKHHSHRKSSKGKSKHHSHRKSSKGKGHKGSQGSQEGTTRDARRSRSHVCRW